MNAQHFRNNHHTNQTVAIDEQQRIDDAALYFKACIVDYFILVNAVKPGLKNGAVGEL
ncbi:hypothetical protein [Undibacterium sp.]|uniref:hypothetical protein n=1 Tax=Undibacterium sp. TaxID=1914977 RepID=UPI00375132E9